MPDKMTDSRVEHRRQWLKTCWRWAALAVLSVLTGRLILRPGPTTACDRRLACDRCGQWQHCGLPKADQARHEPTRSG